MSYEIMRGILIGLISLLLGVGIGIWATLETLTKYIANHPEQPQSHLDKIKNLIDARGRQ